MADAIPKKPLDRKKPFKRIHNDGALVKAPPDGLGVDCGCKTPDDIPDLEAEFKKYLDKNLPFPIVKFLDDVDSTIKTLKPWIQFLEAALYFASWLAGQPQLGLAINAFIDALMAALDAVVQIIRDAIKEFFKSIALEILRRALRRVPQWMPVEKGASNALVGSDQIIEMEGVATRSFANPIDAPFFQYHRWFDWNIQVAPEPEYQNARSPAPDPPDGQTDVGAGEQPITRNNAFEIQVDAGALFSPTKQQLYETGFAPAGMEINDGPYLLADWCWPQTGSYVWAAGRWVYDCSRVTKDKPPRMCTMINPAKAIATARWGAARLPGQAHDLAVPVIDFMFVADQRGGYIGFDTLKGQDVEFIVDLPPGPDDASPYPIAHTGQIPDNTIVVRQQLLRKVSPLAMSDALLIQPKVEPISAGPGKSPRQVKVTVPLSSAKEAGTPSVGFILTMGWFDADGSQAELVKRCTLTLDGFSGRKQIRDDGVNTLRAKLKTAEAALRKAILDAIDNFELPLPAAIKTLLGALGVKSFKLGNMGPLTAAIHKLVNGIIDELFDLLGGAASEREEWLLHFGVNGVWLNLYDDQVDSSPKPLKRTIQFPAIALGPDDDLCVTISGTEFGPVGDLMCAAHLRRVLTKDNVELTWSQICAADPETHKDLVFQYVLKTMFDATTGKLLLGVDNEPLGQVEPNAGAGCAAANQNPVSMKTAQLGSGTVSYSANFARAAGDQLVLVEDASKCDYTISGTLTIDKQ
jgi:hypothetical protein